MFFQILFFVTQKFRFILKFYFFRVSTNYTDATSNYCNYRTTLLSASNCPHPQTKLCFQKGFFFNFIVHVNLLIIFISMYLLLLKLSSVVKKTLTFQFKMSKWNLTKILFKMFLEKFLELISENVHTIFHGRFLIVILSTFWRFFHSNLSNWSLLHKKKSFLY